MSILTQFQRTISEVPSTQTRIVIMQPFTGNIPRDSYSPPPMSEADMRASIGGTKLVFAKQNYLRIPSIIIPNGQVDKLRHRKKNSRASCKWWLRSECRTWG